MRLLGRDSFTRDLLVLFVVGVVAASVFSMGIAVTTDKYFAKAVTGVIGDYGEYDLIFQARSELRAETEKQLWRIIAERFPGSSLHMGLTMAGKSSIFLSFAPKYRSREVFENIDSYFSDLPGSAGFSIVTEPRLVLSAVPSGAQDILRRDLIVEPGVSFIFRDGNSLNLVLKSSADMDRVRAAVKDTVKRYRLLEVRFPINNPVSDLGALGRQLETAVRKVSGVKLSKDVTRGGSSGDMQYMSAALGEMRRFMVSYAARVTVRPVDGARIGVGDRLVLAGRSSRPPIPGQIKEDQFVVVKIDRIVKGVAEGIITQGDSSYIKNPSAFKLMPGNKVGSFIGTVAVVDTRAALGKAIDETVKLLEQARAFTGDPTWDAVGSLRDFQGMIGRITGVRKLLAAVQGGLGTAAAAETRARLRTVADEIDGVSDDLAYLSNTMVRVKLAEDRLSPILDRINAFQYLLDTTILSNAAGQYAGVLAPLTAANRGLTGIGENLRAKAREIDDFINRFNPLVQVLQGWGERARVLAGQLDYLGGVLTPGSKSRQALDGLTAATDSTLRQLQSLDGAGLLSGLSTAGAGLNGINLDSIIEQMQYVRESLPRLLDEEIGRSVGLIDQYLGGDVMPGERIQILTNAGADMKAVTEVLRRASGRAETDIILIPAGSLEPDFRGEVFRVLGEVRTTITALILFALFILEFLLDQSIVVVMFKRQAEAVSRQVLGRRPRLARLAAFLLNPARVYAAVFGAVWLWTCFFLTGARLPLLGVFGAAFVGGIFGLLFGAVAERVNPIDQAEVLAGDSLGLPFVLIMREIVIPAGRPGLLQLLNARRMRMR